MKPISPAAAIARDQARDTDGQFGNQQHAESGEVQVDHILDVPDTYTWRGFNVDGCSEWGCVTPEGDETLTTSPIDGSYRRYLNGHLHRTDGPAVNYPDGEDQFWVNGQLHCTSGAAIRRPGDAPDDYFIEGVLCLPSDICTTDPQQVIDSMTGSHEIARIAEFKGWDPVDNRPFRAQVQMISDAILSNSHPFDTAPFTAFPPGEALVGFNRGTFIHAQYTSFSELSTDHTAVGTAQALAIATALLNKRNHMVAVYNTENPVQS